MIGYAGCHFLALSNTEFYAGRLGSDSNRASQSWEGEKGESGEGQPVMVRNSDSSIIVYCV